MSDWTTSTIRSTVGKGGQESLRQPRPRPSIIRNRQTLLAADAHHALEVLANVPATDLIFSDIMMPGGMSGIQLARTVRQRYPHLGIDDIRPRVHGRINCATSAPARHFLDT
jgi:CheY-like chemotaxis protein